MARVSTLVKLVVLPSVQGYDQFYTIELEAVFLVICQPELYYTSTAVASYATTHFPITGICEEVKILKSLPKVTIYIRRLCSCGWEILFSV